MSLKILCFGEREFLNNTIAALRTQMRPPSEEEIIVDTFDISGKTFLTFSILNNELIASQSAGTNALLYFLSTDISIYQQKDFLFGIFNQRPQFEGLPVVITYEKEQNLSIKDIVNNFELFKVKDRASMIKEVDNQDPDTVKEVFMWINNQVQFQKNKTFDAQPKVVKMKPKYRDSEPESTEKKYEEIVREKNLKGAKVKDQEQAYIGKQKERIKNQNMEKQLANFNKNKKKMAPYDIKATPNPRIQANLHFFLKDPRVEKGAEVNIKIQTDEFKERPKQKQYVPKKTGINIATQIQSTQLFDFDKQVYPILDILTTRALETAVLEIEEEEQTIKIQKYKNTFSDKMKKQNKREEEKIQAERQIIKEKQRLLEMARRKDQTKRNITKKVITYNFANDFLKDIYRGAALRIYNENHYPNNLENQLRTDYLSEVLSKTLVSYEKLIKKESCLENVFEKECLKPVVQKAEDPKRKHNDLKKIKEQRRVNRGNEERYVNVYYDHLIEKKFSSFSKYIDKEFDEKLEAYIAQREEEIQGIEEKHSTNEVDEAQVLRVKQKDNEQFGATHKNFLIHNENNISFTTTSNKFEKPQNSDNLVGGVISFDKEFQVVDTVYSNVKSQCKYIKQVNDLRYFKDLMNMDDGLIINFASVPDQISSFVFFCKVNNVNSFAGQGELKNIKHSSYGLQLYDKAVPLHKQDIGQSVKWEEFAKPPVENEEQKKDVPQESLFIVGYHLSKKIGQYWALEEVKFIGKPSTEENSDFVEKVGNFFRKSQQIFKQEEQEPKHKTPSRNKRRSKKNLVEEKESPRKVQLKMASRVLKEVKLNLSSDFEQNFTKLRDQVVDWKQFIQSCPDGWELEFKGNKLASNEELKKYKKVGDLVLKRVPPPKVEQKEQEPDAEKEENQEDDN